MSNLSLWAASSRVARRAGVPHHWHHVPGYASGTRIEAKDEPWELRPASGGRGCCSLESSSRRDSSCRGSDVRSPSRHDTCTVWGNRRRSGWERPFSGSPGTTSHRTCGDHAGGLCGPGQPGGGDVAAGPDRQRTRRGRPVRRDLGADAGRSHVGLCHHRRQPPRRATEGYVEQVSRSAAPGALLVLDDIDYNDGMRAAWESVRQRPDVAASAVVGKIGLLALR